MQIGVRTLVFIQQKGQGNCWCHDSHTDVKNIVIRNLILLGQHQGWGVGVLGE
jgi:hypothetical protein